MTTSARWSSGHPRPGRSIQASPVTPTTGPDAMLVVTARHESAHGVAEVLLFGEGSVDVLSIRRGRGHLGVCILGPRPTRTRENAEKSIIGLLVGDIAGWQVWSPEPSGYVEDSADEAAAVAATASLDRLSSGTRERLLESESDESIDADETRTRQQAQTLNDYDPLVAEAHLTYLRLSAAALVSRHDNAIRAVAEALLSELVLDGSRVEEIVHASRCACHRLPRVSAETPPASASAIAIQNRKGDSRESVTKAEACRATDGL